MQKRKSENQTIQRLCMNRKQQNFDFLKEWDMERAGKMMVHRKIIDELDESIQDKLVQSNAYIDIVRQFLTDLLTQKIKYELQIVNNPETKIKHNLAGQCIYKHSGKQIGRLFQLTNNYKGYRKLKVILENGLSKLESLLNESEKEIMEMRTTVELKMNELQNSNDLMLEMCNELMGVFNKQKSTKPYLCEKDMYIQQQKFIYQAYIQTKIQRELGIIMANFLEYVEQLQRKKLVLIKEVIGSYLDGVKEEHEDEAQLNLLRDILKKQTEKKYIQQCYSSDELLTTDIIKDLSKILSKHQNQINLKLIKHYLKKFEYNYFQFINYLVLKEYQIFLKIGDELEEIIIIITVDAFLNIVFSKKQLVINDNSQEKLLQKVDYSIKIDSSIVMERNGDITLEIDAKKQYKIWQNDTKMNRLCLIFMNEDQRQQFYEFAQKIMK